MNKTVHPLISKIHGDFIQASIEKQATRENAIESAKHHPSTWWRQHTNDAARQRRIAKSLVGARQLKKMEKAACREAKASVQP